MKEIQFFFYFYFPGPIKIQNHSKVLIRGHISLVIILFDNIFKLAALMSGMIRKRRKIYIFIM